MLGVSNAWWSTAGAVVLLTGVVALAVGTVPTLLRPWVDRKAEARQRREDWRDSARELCVNLEEHLRRMQRETMLNMSSVAMATWGDISELRRQARMVVRFGPTEIRALGADLLAHMESLQQEAIALTKVRDRPDSPEFGAAASAYDARRDHADAKLHEFERAIGEP